MIKEARFRIFALSWIFGLDLPQKFHITDFNSYFMIATVVNSRWGNLVSGRMLHEA
jgi:hypothetical protein